MAALAITDTADGRRILALTGRLDATTLPDLWDKARRAADGAATKPLVVDAAGVEYCDGAGVALFVDLLRHPREGRIEIANLKPAHSALLRQFDPKALEHDLDPEPPRRPAIEEIGFAAYGVWNDVRTQVEFIGETSAALAFAARHPRSVRWRDVWRICERVGADALPIVALISFLLGMILAFQSAVPMKRFGAEIFVADLIGLSMLRELGPLMTAILLAGRSGAAFAAEIGSMKVNEEIDALRTLGLTPFGWLVVPRVVALMLVVPVLTLIADFVGISGGLVVGITDLDLTTQGYVIETLKAVHGWDVLTGLIKSVVFSVTIALIACQQGFAASGGAEGVGKRTTSTVVTSLFALVMIDALFTVIFRAFGV